jgi:hypothetical protein
MEYNFLVKNLLFEGIVFVAWQLKNSRHRALKNSGIAQETRTSQMPLQ